ncbi:hypothetical protein B0H16DRAFT_1557658, partial [Mycena metata]
MGRHHLSVPFYPSSKFKGPMSHDRHKRRSYYWTVFRGYPSVFTSSVGWRSFYGAPLRSEGGFSVEPPFRKLSELSRFAYRWASNHPHEAGLANTAASENDNTRALAAVDNDNPLSNDLLSWSGSERGSFVPNVAGIGPIGLVPHVGASLHAFGHHQLDAVHSGKQPALSGATRSTPTACRTDFTPVPQTDIAARRGGVGGSRIKKYSARSGNRPPRKIAGSSHL